MTATILVGGTYLAPTFALVQNLVGVRMRATAAALLLFVINLIGLGAGPLIVGAMADLMKPVFAQGLGALRAASSSRRSACGAPGTIRSRRAP